MTYNLKIRTTAAKQIDEAFYWYENKKVGLGGDFINEIDKCFFNVTINPFMYGELLENSKYRKILVARFPYSIIFKVRDEKVTVYSIVHHKRKKRI